MSAPPPWPSGSGKSFPLLKANSLVSMVALTTFARNIPVPEF